MFVFVFIEFVEFIAFCLRELVFLSQRHNFFIVFLFLFQFIVLILIKLIILAVATVSYPLQDDDAPIQKIVIRPLTPIRKLPLKPSQRALGPYKSSYENSDYASPVIRVLKNPSSDTAHSHRLHANHLNALIRVSEAYPIYYAQAKANGNFHTIRVLKLK